MKALDIGRERRLHTARSVIFRLNRLALAAVLVSVASVAAAQPSAPLRLKGRTFVPPRNVHAAEQRSAAAAADASLGRDYFIIQFDGPITRADLSALRRAGAMPLRYVPENAVAVSARPGFSPAVLSRARWIGSLAPSDKLSSRSAEDLARPGYDYPVTVVEFQPDLTAAEVSDRLALAGTSRIQSTRVPAHVALIETDRTAVERLTADDAVAWIYPASPDATAPGSVMCGGLVSPHGLVADYAVSGEGWDGAGRGAADLTYFQSNSSTEVPFSQSSAEVVRALQEWSRYVSVRWRPATGPQQSRSLTIFWTTADHGDGYPFDAEVLAHAFYQAPLTPEPLAGDVHFNEAFDWGVSDPSRYDVFSVMLHEAGHSLGLSHSSDPDAVMYPMYRGIVNGLAADDIAAVRSLYGSATTGTSSSDAWSQAAIGGSSGAMQEAEGVFTVTATGLDVWGAADQLRFVSRPLTGDGDIVARVDTFSAPHHWAKAGVMIRASGAAGAPHAFMLVSASRGLAFQRRRLPDGASLSTAAVPGAAPMWVWLSRRGDRFSAYAAADQGGWMLIGSDTIAMGQTVQAGLALTSHDQTRTAQAVFSHVSVTAATAWRSADIGPVGRAGSVTGIGPQLRVAGAGLDIWGAEDAFHFAWRPLAGDGEIVARVTQVQNTDRWAKAGVMIRSSLGAGASHALMLVSPGRGYAFQRRTTTGGASAHTAGGTGAAPGWVRLRRRGTTITAYRSNDGVNWTVVGSDTITMGATVYAGLAVSSHVAGTTCLAEFDRVSLR